MATASQAAARGAVVRGLARLTPPAGGAVVTAGTFDGVHAGHRVLLDETVARARRRGVVAAAVTWDRHPLATLRPQAAPRRLATVAQKTERLRAAGLDLVLVLRFDAELASWPADEFVARVLADGLGAVELCVGADWRFGRGGAGDVALLERLAERHEFDVSAVERRAFAGMPGSSTAVRAAVAAGDLALAAALLGRPFEVDARVELVDGPLLVWLTGALDLAAPPDGTYAARLRSGATSVPCRVAVERRRRAARYCCELDAPLPGAAARTRVRLELLERSDRPA